MDLTGDDDDEANTYQQIVNGYKAQLVRLQRQKGQFLAERAKHEAAMTEASTKADDCSQRIDQVQKLLQEETEDRARQIQTKSARLRQVSSTPDTSRSSIRQTPGETLAAGVENDQRAEEQPDGQTLVSNDFITKTHAPRHFFDPLHEISSAVGRNRISVDSLRDSTESMSMPPINTRAKRDAHDMPEDTEQPAKKRKSDGSTRVKSLNNAHAQATTQEDEYTVPDHGRIPARFGVQDADADQDLHQPGKQTSGSLRRRNYSHASAFNDTAVDSTRPTRNDEVEDPDFDPDSLKENASLNLRRKGNYAPNLGFRRPERVNARWYCTDYQWAALSGSMREALSHAGRMMEVEGYGVLADKPCSACEAEGCECIVYPVEYQLRNGRRCAHCRYSTKSIKNPRCEFPGDERK
ncbi:hypothetical protein MBLNU230_g3208t1 [Neophaeotheca triangularis]